jgi:O-antigen ligase
MRDTDGMFLDHFRLPRQAAPHHLERASDWLVEHMLPIGWILLLTGMFWIGDRARYHTLYYFALLTPTLLALALRPARLKILLSSPLLVSFGLFGLYMILTITWSNTDYSTAKRPFYILFLFFSGGLLALKCPRRLLSSLQISAGITTLAALVSLGIYYAEGASGRFPGYGALYNPLLSSHVYGFFLAFWMAHWFGRENPFDPVTLFSLFILGALILATGSRTPIMALAACSAWLMGIHGNKRSLIALVALVSLGTLLLLFHPDALFSRGLSYRPEIWRNAGLQILNAPWFGYGYDAPMRIWVPGLDYALADPHNIWLAVLYAGGIVGLALWLLFYAVALGLAWRNRREPMGLMASTWVVFGLVASMTEGNSFLSRPKEHWFLIWIPMTLLLASELTRKIRRDPASPAGRKLPETSLPSSPRP